MNEEQVKKILAIEDEAQSLYEQAVKSARQLPITAQSDARALIERTRNQAMAEADMILHEAREEAASIASMQSAEDETRRKESVAMLHFEQAVYFVLDRIMGKG